MAGINVCSKMSHNIMSVVEDSNCSGCSACALICPKDAIKMEFNPNGFYAAVISPSMCVQCGQCLKVCSSQNKNGMPISKENVFVAVAKNRVVLKKSSSGGVGHVFAQQALKMGYAVCGVQYSKEKNAAEHVIIDNEKDLEKIQGSKYLQSANYSAFDQFLDVDKGVIFGTPCQIAGIDSVLTKRNKRADMVLVDIFCHGVPSQLVWKRHLEWLSRKNKIADSSDVLFRQGKNFRLKIGKYNAWYNEDAFYTFFLRGWAKNKICHTCAFRRSSAADIRIGDCLTDKYKQLSYSPSCIIVNTPKGEMYLKQCADLLDIFSESYCEIDKIQENGNTQIHDNYDFFIDELKKGNNPNNLIKRTMLFGKVKSIIKNRLINRFLKRDNIEALDNFNINRIS